MCVDLALKYIYGGGKSLSQSLKFLRLRNVGLVIESSVSEEHFAELCVLLWRCADFLLLYKLKMSVEKAVRSYCDKRLKQLCTWNSATKVHDPDRQNTLSPWGLDLVLGVKRAYDLKVEDLKAVFMEFIWIGRMWTFRNGNAAALRNHLSDTPAFMDDLLAKYASGPWMKTAVWAPEHKDCYTQEDQCRTCTKKISWSEKSEGQVLDPFTVDYNRFKFIRGWCRACSEGDKIPWRG